MKSLLEIVFSTGPVSGKPGAITFGVDEKNIRPQAVTIEIELQCLLNLQFAILTPKLLQFELWKSLLYQIKRSYVYLSLDSVD